MIFKFFFTACLLFAVTTLLAADEISISFKSSDDLLITADLYTPHTADTTPLILLFHQAGSSRGEYDEIAPELNKLGFNCIAVDLRSGEYARGKDNETAIRASEKNLATSYADALPDIVASIRYARQHYKNKVIIWGSSYSAALVLKVAGDNPQLVDGVIAFSPGEYFAHLGKSKTWIRDSAKKIVVPVFISSARSEVSDWMPIFDVIDPEIRNKFVPVTVGKHGSRALWSKQSDSTAYWSAITKFLNSNFLSNPSSP
jgi:dienelactone hydrolase